MACTGVAAECFRTGVRGLQTVSNWITDGPAKIFANVDPLNDTLHLTQRVYEIAKKVLKWPVQFFAPISKAISQITDFVGARNFIGRISDIVSGKAAWEKPIAEGVPNFLKVMSKIAYLFTDFTSTVKWLVNIHVLGKWVTETTSQLTSWGKEFQLLKGIGDVSRITGALLNIVDTVRLIAKEIMSRGYFIQGRFNGSLVIDHLLDLACDVTKVAASVLSNIPGVKEVYSLVSLAVGSAASLAKFFKKSYWSEKDLPPIPPEGGSSSCDGSGSSESSPAVIRAGEEPDTEEELPSDFDEQVRAEMERKKAEVGGEVGAEGAPVAREEVRA